MGAPVPTAYATLVKTASMQALVVRFCPQCNRGHWYPAGGRDVDYTPLLGLRKMACGHWLNIKKVGGA